MADADNIKWTHLRETLERFGEYFVEQARKNLLSGGNPPHTNSNASGTLTDSLEYEVEIGEDAFRVTVYLEDYWKYVNDGRGAGKVPIPAIRDWIKVKGIKPEERNGKRPTVEQLPFAIAKKIEKEGYKGTHFFDRAKDDAREYFEESIFNAIREDMDEFTETFLVAELDKFVNGIC